MTYMELNGQVTHHARQGGVTVSDTGGHEIYLSPGLQWVPRTNVLVEGSVQVPTYQDIYGTQLATDVRMGAGIRSALAIASRVLAATPRAPRHTSTSLY